MVNSVFQNLSGFLNITKAKTSLRSLTIIQNDDFKNDSDETENLIVKQLEEADLQDFSALEQFELECYSDSQQYWLDSDDVRTLLDLVPASVAECHIRSQDELHNIKQFL